MMQCSFNDWAIVCLLLWTNLIPPCLRVGSPEEGNLAHNKIGGELHATQQIILLAGEHTK